MTKAEIIEYLYENHVRGDLSIEEMAEALAEDEPTISKMEQVDEPSGYNLSPVEGEQTETKTETQNSNLTFEKCKCIDCNFLTYMFGKTWCNIKCENPHDKVCDRFKPKDEPQTEYKKWEMPNTDTPTENTTCVGVAMALIEDEPQTDCPWK